MKGKITIERELCKGCRYCVLACPEGVIVIDDTFNTNGYFPAKPANPDTCSGCALCALMCPDIAIKVRKE